MLRIFPVSREPKKVPSGSAFFSRNRMDWTVSGAKNKSGTKPWAMLYVGITQGAAG
jgi:hypothetical protein